MLWFWLILASLVIGGALVAGAQKPVKVDAQGNYTALSSKTVNKVPDKTNGKFFIDSKGNKYPVYVSVNGKLYYLKTAKSGNVYKVYLLQK